MERYAITCRPAAPEITVSSQVFSEEEEEEEEEEEDSQSDSEACPSPLSFYTSFNQAGWQKYVHIYNSLRVVIIWWVASSASKYNLCIVLACSSAAAAAASFSKKVCKHACVMLLSAQEDTVAELIWYSGTWSQQPVFNLRK